MKKILIIGGGIAGLEAAGQLLDLGHKPIIVERASELGGHVSKWNRLFPDMISAHELVTRLVSRAMGAETLLNTNIRSINRLKDSYNIILDNGRTVRADAVLMASGFKLFDAGKKEEYGYGIYDRVITNEDLERWFNTSDDKRIPEHPQRIGFVHCVGSRDIKAGNSQCSKVCCMTAIKQAIELKQMFPITDIYCFYMDLRLFGKKYEDFYIQAQKDYGIHFIRGRVSEVGETIDGRLQVKAEDTLNGKPLKVTMDLLVLMAGMCSNESASDLARMMRVETDTDGFLKSENNIDGITTSNRAGVFFAGACTGTKTVPETISEARAAALAIHKYLG